ncbi:MAG: cytochrome c3 family protein [Bryobacteraceae bacterium]
MAEVPWHLRFLSLALFLQGYPEYTSGDQCLFCHRSDIGPSWQGNAHNRTTRFDPDGKAHLGARTRSREVRKSGYGRLDLREPGGSWNATKFGERCAGCHTTAVDPGDLRFASPGLDCVTCHGAVDLHHSSDTSKVLLSKKTRAAATVESVNAICASCHLRGGKSRSTGRPYPNAYIPGADLFADWEVNLAAPGHVARSVRERNSCLGCHDVHRASSNRHRRAAPGEICLDCHYEGRPRKEFRPPEAHDATCEY